MERFEVIETHISWVLLTGPYAYKIKKPMDFGFLDFTSLDKRRFYCNEELRLNQRLTDDLYLEVLPITGSEEAPRIGGDGEAIEYLLKMRQFPQDNLLAAIQGRGELSNQHIDELAEQIAHFHQNTPKVPLEHPLGTAESCMAPVRQNFEQVRPLLRTRPTCNSWMPSKPGRKAASNACCRCSRSARRRASSANATATSTWATPR